MPTVRGLPTGGHPEVSRAITRSLVITIPPRRQVLWSSGVLDLVSMYFRTVQLRYIVLYYMHN